METLVLAISFSPKNTVKINDEVMSVKCSELFGDVWQKASLWLIFKEILPSSDLFFCRLMLRPQDKVMPDWLLNKPSQQTAPKAGAFFWVPHMWLRKAPQQSRSAFRLGCPGLSKDAGAKHIRWQSTIDFWRWSSLGPHCLSMSIQWRLQGQ